MTRAWLVRCGGGGRYVDDAVSRGIITVDFREATDVTGMTVSEIAAQLSASTTRVAIDRLAELLHSFANDISEGDAVVTSDRARRQVVVGRVTGPYEWRDTASIPLQHHTRAVDWRGRCDWDDLPEPVSNAALHYQATVLEFPDQTCALAFVDEVERAGLPAIATSRVRVPSGPSLPGVADLASRQERLCKSCFLYRPLSEFQDDAEVCALCA